MIHDEEILGCCRRYFDKSPAAARRVLLVGEDNPYSGRLEHALYCHPPQSAGARLQGKILGLDPDVYLALWRTNLCLEKWSQPRARDRARLLVSEDAPWDVIVMLGAKVAEAFGTAWHGLVPNWEPRPFRSYKLCRSMDAPIPPAKSDVRWVDVVCLPHPSGRGQGYNPVGAIGAARKLLAEVAPGMGWAAP